MAVSAQNFVRKDKSVGSWDPNSTRWDDIDVKFISAAWYDPHAPKQHVLKLGEQELKNVCTCDAQGYKSKYGDHIGRKDPFHLPIGDH
jgi:hypothetical protein